MTSSAVPDNQSGALSDRLAALRSQFAHHGVDGWLVAREDMFQGEEVPPGEERLAFISGFTGSAGFAVILADKAALFSDGRYSLQMADQSDAALWTTHTQPDESLADWLKSQHKAGHIADNLRLGIDPQLTTVAGYDRIAAAVAPIGGTLMAVAENPIDSIWPNRPSMPPANAFMMDDAIAGETAVAKLDRLDAAVQSAGADAIILSRVDAVNWLVNMRGADLPCQPVNLAFALYHRENGLIILGEPGRLTPLLAAGISVVPLAQLAKLIDPVAGYDQTTKILIEPASLPRHLFDILSAATVTLVNAACPVTMLKAQKNDTELAGIRRAHQEDGAALVRFLAWLDNGGATGMTESDIAAYLLEIRRESPRFIASSFDSICGSGPNGAIVHYRAMPGMDNVLLQDNLLLLDSGAHYHDGTTDITRTIAIGTPDDAMCRAFTTVLKGHISLALARFPADTNGTQLDVIARMPLWAAGIDYAHGTGHGVGHVLQVHEGPASISKRGTHAMKPGMFLSNEPGYYRTGEWGIRIENLVAVNAPDDAGFLSFETVTLCPIDRRLIVTDMLTTTEAAWLNAYHLRVLQSLSSLRDILDDAHQNWLQQACAPL